MSDIATRIPVIWETTEAVADRLLSKTGRPLLEQALKLADNLAAERRWPLKKIKVTHYEDPEIVWEYLLLVLVFDSGHPMVEGLWHKYMEALDEAIEGMYQELKPPEQGIFANMIDYEFDGNP